MPEEQPFHQVFPAPEMEHYDHESFMGGVRLSKRLGLFVLLGLGAMAAAGSGLYIADRELTAAEQRLAAAHEVADFAASIESKAWQIRSDEKDFLLRKDPQYVAIHKANVSSISEALNTLYIRPDTEFIKEHITTINEGLAQYSTEFHGVVKMGKAVDRGETGGLWNKLNVSSRALEAKIAETENAALIDLMAAIRLSEKNFTARGATKDMVLIKKLSDEMSALIESAKVGEEDKTLFSKLMADYQANVTAFARGRLAQKKGIGRLDEIFSYMVTSMDSLAAYTGDRIAVASEEVLEIRRLVRLLIPSGGAVILLIVISLGHALMRSIATPLRIIAESARRLSEEEDAPVPTFGEGDEVGELAASLGALKAKLAGIQQLRLDYGEQKAAADNGKVALAESKWIRKDLESAMSEAAKLRKELEEAKSEVEKNEAAAIEAALLRIDLEATKAELVKIEGGVETAPAGEREPASPPLPGIEVVEPGAPSQQTPSGPISTISRQVTKASQSASLAVYEAERTSTLIRGLTSAAEKIGEVETMLASINDQTDILLLKPEPDDATPGGDADNLVVLASEYRNTGDQAAANPTSANETAIRRFDSIRTTTSQITWAMKDIAGTIDEVRKLAMEIAAASSAEALEITTELLEQSKHLRGMLDTLVDNIKGSPAGPSPKKTSLPPLEHKPPSKA